MKRGGEVQIFIAPTNIEEDSSRQMRSFRDTFLHFPHLKRDKYTG